MSSRSTTVVLILNILSALPLAAQSQPPSADVSALLRRVTADIGHLRLELAEHRIDCVRHKLPELEQELRLAKQEQGRIREQEQAHSRGMQEFENTVGQVTDTDEQAQAEVLRKAHADALESLKTATVSAVRRESEIEERILVERQKLEHLMALTRQLAAGLNGR